MKVLQTPAELRAAREKLTGRVAVVMTMGALHSGHEELLRAAAGQADHVIATIFVNPLQFGPAEDFDRYPRTLESDLAACERAGVDIVFTPSRDGMYPQGTPTITVDPGQLGTELEGTVRPGHFAGVLTVVFKLLSLTAADVALFGEKDYQQLTLIRAMARDLDLPVEIVGVPTVREADGLALSSRNRYLDDDQRQLALGLSAALRAGAAEHRADAVLAAAQAALDPRIDVDYLVLRGADLGEVPASGPARLLIAARLGTTRLIDNIAIALKDDH
ncbi:pantoate--beta-alanine ligase [Allocatelliglobosispora scoriae]|uniref:Pantothenate synthetase n=1 Tax=Allocatelliglobosispora scoriae TaxID=643052 RepID=A0A841BV13_9ACTN|nr:pantoate--beta-alanine ligase [Allocatelliglobosispora scoriae]MBB5870753.1 pantoate--beta-alanine ligase [Allocatelliglobosispora scoriae]